MDVSSLKTEIESTHFHAFWYGSPLLQQCVDSGSEDLVQALALRHHGLQNKDAGSCHVLRQTIIRIDGPEFPALWNMFDSDPDDPATTIESPLSPLWAAAYILGEIGGLCALRGFSDRLSPEHAPHHFAVVRGLVHVIDRYRIISEEGEPMGTLIDTKTGEQKLVCTKDIDPEAYTRTINDRMIANRHFDATPLQFLSELKLRLSCIDSAVVRFDIDRIIGFVDLVFPQADVQDRINAEMARRFLERPDLVDLSKAKLIDDDAAEILAIHKGDLYLDGLTSLSNAAVKALSLNRTGLSLDGLTTLSDADAEALSQISERLSLDGLTNISEAVAEALSKLGGRLSLDGLTSLSDLAAEALSRHGGGLSDGLSGGLYLNGLTSLSDVAAEAFSRHQGLLQLYGLTNLSEAAALALSKHRGLLCLNRSMHSQVFPT